MPLPVLVGLGVLAAGGVTAGAKGIIDLSEARKDVKKSDERQLRAAEKFDRRREATQERVAALCAEEILDSKASFVGTAVQSPRRLTHPDASEEPLGPVA